MARVIFNPVLALREDLRQLQPYQPHDHTVSIRLDNNENPYPFPEPVIAEMQHTLNYINVNRYPDPVASDLRRELARYAGVGAGQIMVGNGSDELIFNLIMAFGSGRKVVIAEPTFSIYRIHSRIAGAEPVVVQRKDDFSIDAGAVVEVVQQTGSKLVMLCSPNNPTGNATPLSIIEEILANTEAVVVVDQAYLEFGGDDCLPLLSKYSQLVILRTFSKAFGMAGLRVGYLLAHPGMVKELMRVKQPYNVNSFSQRAAQIALKNLPAFQEQWQQIIADRDKLLAQFSALGLKVFPTEANFILVQHDQAARLYQQLLAEGILVRHMGGALASYLRIGIGTTAENERLVETLQSIMAKE